MSTLYVDVSHHDWSRHGGQLDWAKIRAATSPVMVARATYGDPAGFSPDTRHFGSMVSAAKQQGFLCGAYHNLIRGDQASINRQVDWLRREMDAAGAVWAMLDVERYEELLTRNLHPRFEDAQRFADRWHAVDSRVLTMYLPRWIWDGHMGRPDLRPLRCPLVASNYGSNPDGSPAAVYAARGGDSGAGWNAYGGVTPTVWQYGSNIDCPGASGATDVNAYRGTLAQLRALLTGQPEEVPDMDATQARQLAEVHELLTRWRAGMPTMADGERTIEPVGWRIRDEVWQGKVSAALSLLSGKDWTDEAAIVAGVLAGLDPAAIAAAIPPTIAKQVADELARRMAADTTPQS